MVEAEWGTGQVVTPAAHRLMEAECWRQHPHFPGLFLGGEGANLSGHGKMGRDSQESC